MGWLKNIVNTIKDVTIATVVQPIVSTVNAVGGNVSQPKYETGVGNFLGDVAKSASQPLSSTVNAFGAKTSVGKYETDVGSFLGDLGKVGAEPIKNSFGSITGKDNDFVYETKVGKDLGGIVELGVDSGHTALKTYADTLSGGYASKVVNLVRADEYKESAGNYNEQKEIRFEPGSTLGSVENVVMKGAPIVGTIGASLLKSKDESEGNGSVKVLDDKGGGLGDGVGTGSVVNNVTKAVDNVVQPITKVTTDNMASGNVWGDIASSVLGSAVTALIDNSQDKPAAQQQASVAAFTNPYVNSITAQQVGQATAAAFGVNTGSGGVQVTTKETWWDRNKSWAMPVSIGVSVLFSFVFLIMAIAKRRR